MNTNKEVYESEQFVQAYVKKAPKKFNKYKDFLFKHLQGVEKKTNILDIGCGPGYTANQMAKLEFNVTGIDFSETFINFAKANYSSDNCNFLQVNQENLLDIFELGQFDVITTFNVILHLPLSKITEHFRQIHQLLNPTGILIGQTKITEASYEGTITDPEEKFGYEITRDYTFLSKKDLFDYLNNSGFEIIDQNELIQGITGKEESHLIQFFVKKL